MGDRDRDWDWHLRTLSSSARDSNVANDPASDSSLLQSVSPLSLFLSLSHHFPNSLFVSGEKGEGKSKAELNYEPNIH